MLHGYRASTQPAEAYLFILSDVDSHHTTLTELEPEATQAAGLLN